MRNPNVYLASELLILMKCSWTPAPLLKTIPVLRTPDPSLKEVNALGMRQFMRRSLRVPLPRRLLMDVALRAGLDVKHANRGRNARSQEKVVRAIDTLAVARTDKQWSCKHLLPAKRQLPAAQKKLSLSQPLGKQSTRVKIGPPKYPPNRLYSSWSPCQSHPRSWGHNSKCSMQTLGGPFWNGLPSSGTLKPPAFRGRHFRLTAFNGGYEGRTNTALLSWLSDLLSRAPTTKCHA